MTLNALLPPILWAAMIFLLSHQEILPGSSVDTLDFIFKKSAHITVYAVLFLLVHRAQLLLLAKKYHSNIWITSFAIVALYAISDEVHQTFVPGRFGTLRDVGFDVLGASLAFLKQYRYI